MDQRPALDSFRVTAALRAAAQVGDVGSGPPTVCLVTHVLPVTVASAEAWRSAGVMAFLTAVISLYVVVGVMAMRFAPTRVGNEPEPY